jgi:hypothetical protein
METTRAGVMNKKSESAVNKMPMKKELAINPNILRFWSQKTGKQ